MTEAAAKDVLLYGLAIGVAIWFLGIWLWRRLIARPQTIGNRLKVTGKTTASLITDLLPFFLQGGLIKEQTANTLVMESRFFQAKVQGTDQSGGSDLEITIDFTEHRGIQKWMGVIVLLVEPIVIFGLFLVLWYQVAPSQYPNVRLQVYQIGQIVHVLWPPFLLYFLHGKTRTMASHMATNLTKFLSTRPTS